MSNKEKVRFWTGDRITSMTGPNIFVFGSNPEGRHGLGAAIEAVKFGAKRGCGRGLMGNAYALVTKNLTAGYYEKSTGITYEKSSYESVSKEQISKNIDELYTLANDRTDLVFFICYQYEKWPKGNQKKSLNGYKPLEIIDLFIQGKTIPSNIRFHNSFREFINKSLEKRHDSSEYIL